jgi:hypothetical protein
MRGDGKLNGEALERQIDRWTDTKRCHNQAKQGYRANRKLRIVPNVVTDGLRNKSERSRCLRKFIKRCHNRANKGLRRLKRLGFPLGASLACQGPPIGGPQVTHLHI